MSRLGVTAGVAQPEYAEMLAKMRELQAQLEAERATAAKREADANERIAHLERERDNLRASHERLRIELELFKRRLLIAKAERADNEQQLRLEFAQRKAELDRLAGTLGIAQHDDAAADETPARDGKPKGKRNKSRGTGRRDLKDLPLPEEELEFRDAHLEKLADEGKVARHGWEVSYKLGHRKASKVRLCLKRMRYKAVDAVGDADVITAAMAAEMLPRSLMAPSLAAHVIMENVGKGLPLFRIEDTLVRDGAPLDRGTLARMKKLVGDALGPTVVRAMREHALASAFCISTDATGVNVQPIYSHEKGSQPCKKGSFLVLLADRDHILYEYLEKEDGRAIHGLFRGFSGYLQADAKSVYHLLFADPAELAQKAPELDHDGCERVEVGCWFHARRRFWEAATAKCRVAQEGMVRIGRIFELDSSWNDKPPSEIKALRERYLRPHVDMFFAWVEEQWALFEKQRGFTRTALGYARNWRRSSKSAALRSRGARSRLRGNSGARSCVSTAGAVMTLCSCRRQTTRPAPDREVAFRISLRCARGCPCGRVGRRWQRRQRRCGRACPTP
jgi:transposase